MLVDYPVLNWVSYWVLKKWVLKKTWHSIQQYSTLTFKNFFNIVLGRLGDVFLKVVINLKTFYSYLFSTNVNKHFMKDYLYSYKLDFRFDFSYAFFLGKYLLYCPGKVKKHFWKYFSAICLPQLKYKQILHKLPFGNSNS